MRRIRYQVACSLDGYVAGPDGEIDWIVADPDIDFAALFAQFDTLADGSADLMVLTGHRVYETSGIVLLEYDVRTPEREAS